VRSFSFSEPFTHAWEKIKIDVGHRRLAQQQVVQVGLREADFPPAAVVAASATTKQGPPSRTTTRGLGERSTNVPLGAPPPMT